jgi:O-antigen/teichoic acid export membrane protein
VNIPQRVAFNTAVQLLARIVSVALALVSFGLVTRYLGVSGFGEYSLVLAFVALLVPIADLGLTLVGVRELAAKREPEGTLLGNLFGLRLLVALAASITLFAISPLFPYSDRVESGLRLGAIAVFFLVLSGVPTIVFQSRVRLDLAAIVDFVTAAATLTLIVLFTKADLGFISLILASVLAAILAASVGFALASRFVRLRPKFQRTRARSLLVMALQVGLYMILGIIHFRIDTVLLSLLKPVEDVGIYGAAYRFLEQALFFPGLFMASVYPILALLVANRDPGLQLAVDKSLTFLLATAFPLAASSFILAPDIVFLIAGRSFSDAVEPMRVLVFASVFIFTNVLFSSLLILYDQKRPLLLLVAGALVLNVTLNLILIPPYSYVGAAVATVITEGCVGVAITFAALRSAGLSLHLAPLPRIVIASAGMSLVLWLTLPLPFGVTLVAGLAAYAVLSYLLGVVTRADLALLLTRRDTFAESPPV